MLGCGSPIGAITNSTPSGGYDFAPSVGSCSSTTSVLTDVQRTQMRQALAAELRAVGHHDHFVGRVHHGPFGFHQAAGCC